MLDTDFDLIILKQDWQDLKLGYKAQQALAALEATHTSDHLYVITLNEIEQYDWDKQTLTLTQVATQGLGQALISQGRLKDDNIQALVDLKKSLGWGNPIERALYTKAFVVKVENEFLYGGIFLDAVSQMAIDYPVARIFLQDGQAVISLLPCHIPFVMTDPVNASGQARDLTITPEAREDVRQLNQADGFLTKWILGLATSDRANRLRQQMRDVRLYALLETSGKLKSA